MKKSFLFLQGPMGPFFREMGIALRAQGHASQRILFNGGDHYFCQKNQSIAFNGTLANWPEFLKKQATSLRVTDVVMYGDCRPFHRVAIETLKPMGVTVHVFEEGYLRPSWVTYERGGVNAFSTFGAQLPQLLDEPAKLVTTPRRPAQSKDRSMMNMGMFASLYYASCMLNRRKFSEYSHHFNCCVHRYMLQWLPRLCSLPLRRAEAFAKRKWLKKQAFYLVPLQLERDYQVIQHSAFNDMRHFIATVMESFARQNVDARLVFKNHPLDNGMTSLRSIIKEEAKRHGIAKRVTFIDAGRLPLLLKRARGVVTINSTSGLSALHHDKPTIALGRAIYNLEGLTFNGRLDEFWKKAKPPSPLKYAQLRNLLIEHTQLSGGFYSKIGRERLVPAAVACLLQQPKPMQQNVEFEKNSPLLASMQIRASSHYGLMFAALNLC